MSKSYSYDDALKASTEYFNGNELPARVFLDKYALRDNEQNLVEKTPTDMHWRIAKEFARVQKKKYKKPLTEDIIFSYLDQFAKIIPQGSPMYGIGNPYQTVSLSNCYVIDPPLDSYAGILKTDEELAQISKRRGGNGTDVENLRPAGTTTHNAARTSTGSIPFCTRFSNTIREVGQSGRRGALMLTQNIHHPESVIPWDDEVDGEPFEVKVSNKDVGDFTTNSKCYNPKKIDFCTMKYDATKVTGANISLRLSDEFLNAVEKETKYQQRWPVDVKKNAPISKWVDANAVWDKIVTSAWRCAEPGILFWDNIIKESIPDCYAEFGFKSRSTNPCIVGDTLVYLADGRGNVSIKQLAEEGKDIPVFCYDKEGKVVIRTMRNPRVTGYKKTIFKVTLDDGSTIRVTENHKFMTTEGVYKEVKDLKPGDSLKILTRYEAPIVKIENKNKHRVSKKDYYWINSGFQLSRCEHRIIAENAYGDIQGSVIHHKDYNTKNNAPGNLLVMSKKDHDNLHSKDMIGDKNPMRRAKTEWSKEKWDEYRKNMSEAMSGEGNGRFSGITNDKMREHAIALTKINGRRFTDAMWVEYAKEHDLPQGFSKFRKDEFGSVVEMAIWAAEQCGISNADIDPRLVKTLKDASEQYNARIIDNAVFVEKTCEHCGKIFEINYFQREVACCSRSCSNYYVNNHGTNEKRTTTINKTYAQKSHKNQQEQLRIYTDLKFNFKRDPLLSEWENACQNEGIPFRLKTKYGFKNYKELKEKSTLFNHRVVSVEKDGFEDVYNGTVDEFHNFFIGAFDSKTSAKKHKWLYLNNLNCGEIILCANDSCRLLLLNLFGFVVNPFTKDAYFDYKAFYEAAKVAQMLMDDLIDLEEECINKILAKIKADPEPDYIKARELQLWQNILKMCQLGRRTGTGVTALGDTLAAIGIGYGTNEGIKETEKIYKTLKFGAYASSVEIAKEIGAFPVWDHNLEKNNPYLNRFKNEVIVLSQGGSDGEKINGKDIWDDMKKYGRRNIALLTTAPAGSVSILAKLWKRFNSSSGVEPQYEAHYIRKKKGNPGDKNFRSDSVDQNGDHWMHFVVDCAALEDWKEVTGNTEYEKSPWYKNCAVDIDWALRVKLQATAQKHVDHSISSTVNLPRDVSIEKVKEIYTTAWKAGCKGITIYRDGCRTGVLVKDDKNTIKKTDAPPRPESLPCDVHHVKVKGEEYFVLVGLMGQDPYEMFAGKNGFISKSVKNGIITKKSRGRYDAVFENGAEFSSVAEYINNEEEALTRMVSTALRHGADIKFIVHQLEKVKGDLFGFSKALSRALKKYIPDGSNTYETKEACPKCGGNLIRQDGCVKCPSCGDSKCN